MKRLFLLATLLLCLFGPALALAQTNSTINPGDLPGSNITLTEVLPAVIRYFLMIIAFTAFLGFIYSGFILITSGGDPAKAQLAHKNMLWAIIGIVITLISYTVLVVASNLLNPDNSGINPLNNGQTGGSAVAPTVSLTDGSGVPLTGYSIDNANSSAVFPIKVTLASKPDTTVAVAVGHDGELPLTVDTSSLTFTPDNWDRAQQVTVTYSGDGQPTQKGRVLLKIGGNQSQSVLFTAASL